MIEVKKLVPLVDQNDTEDDVLQCAAEASLGNPTNMQQYRGSPLLAARRVSQGPTNQT